MNTDIVVVCVVTTCNLVVRYRRFARTCCLYLRLCYWIWNYGTRKHAVTTEDTYKNYYHINGSIWFINYLPLNGHHYISRMKYRAVTLHWNAAPRALTALSTLTMWQFVSHPSPGAISAIIHTSSFLPRLIYVYPFYAILFLPFC